VCGVCERTRERGVCVRECVSALGSTLLRFSMLRCAVLC